MDTPSSIYQAKAFAATGDKKAAMELLRNVLKENPKNVDAWLALADIVDKPEHARQCFNRVLLIDPTNQYARNRLLDEQPAELGFRFENNEQLVQKPASTQPAFPELDFSNLYAGENQPSQSGVELNQSNDESVPTPPPFVPAIEASPRQPAPSRRAATHKRDTQNKKGISRIEILLFSIIGFLCVCIGFSGLVAIGRDGLLSPEPTSLPEEVTAVIYENIRASNTKDIEGYMLTIHSRSPVYNATKRGVEQAFSDKYTLSYRISDVYIIEQSSTKAIVHFVLTTRLISGSIDFRDNRVTGEMELRTEDGIWKIYNQEVISVDYLD